LGLPELFCLLSVMVSAASAGFLYAYAVQLKDLKAELKGKVETFAEITKMASEANTTLAEKILQVDQKLDNIEAWRSMMGLNTSPNVWKK
jgi:uncharacterized protein YwgA